MADRQYSEDTRQFEVPPALINPQPGSTAVQTAPPTQPAQPVVPPTQTDTRPLSAHESRALTMGLEAEYQIPTGSLQAINEHMTGYRKDNPMLPQHVQRSPSRLEEHMQAAQRFHEKLAEFDGVMPLAVDAYYRGDKATRASLSGEGFPHAAVDNVYATLARMPKYGGQEFSDSDYAVMASVFGEAPGNYTGQRNAPIPKPAVPGKLRQISAGRYLTGDPLDDAIMSIESGNPENLDAGGDTNAVSPTGATGIYQMTKGTARQYNLITKDGRDLRKDPEANYAAYVQLKNDNIRALTKAGIQVEPFMVYMAHQQGAGGLIKIIKAAQQGKEVPPDIRANMNVNGGRGKTPAQFLAMFKEKFDKRYNYFAAKYGQQVVPQQMADILPPDPVQQNLRPLDQVLMSLPTTSAQQSAEAAGISSYTSPADAQEEAQVGLKRNVNWMTRLETAFVAPKVSNVPVNVSNAIKGIMASV